MRPLHMLFRALLVATSVARLLAGEGLPGGAPRVITRVAEIRALSREEAARGLPVRVCGVVTWQSAMSNHNFVIDDGEQGIYVASLPANQTVRVNGGEEPGAITTPGSQVEIEGVSNPGGCAPIIVSMKIRRVGSRPLPLPRHVALECLLAGNEDSQRIQVEGVVQEVAGPDPVGITMVSMMVEGHLCRVNFERGREIVAALLVDARVRVCGVLAPMLNLRAEVASFNLNAMGAADMEILVPPPDDPFHAPRVDLDRLLPFSPDRAPFHRRVTSGVVILVRPAGFFFLQTANTGVRVDSAAAKVRVGECVEVAGFVETSHTLASIRGGLVRSLGNGTVPAPLEVKVKQLMDSKVRHGFGQPDTYDYSGRLVRLTGKMIKIERDEMKRPQQLLVEAEGQTFAAMPTGADAGWSTGSTAWVEGAELALTGVCELEFGNVQPTRYKPAVITGFQLWLRTPQDVQVLGQPSWWTSTRLQLALVWAGVIIGVGVVWIFLLRWSLRRRTERLEQVMRSHRNIELEYDSAQRERLRLAVDLHDGIKQHLAAATFRVDAAAGNLPDSPATAAVHLETAHSTLLRTQTELEECLWGLHAVAEGPPDFVNLLHHVPATNETWPKGAVRIVSEGTPRHLPRDVAGSLLLLFQEAGGNAFRHGRATSLAVTVSYGAEAFDLRVVDDGSGFDPRAAPASRAGHFGIDGMKQRMRWLGGTLHLIRHARGMEIHARLPWSELRHAEVPEFTAASDSPRGHPSLNS